MVKVDDGEHVKYLLNETDYLRLINPQKKELWNTPLLTIAKELEPLLVLY